MALRKDQIQALKDSLCLDNVDPATRSALNNLVDSMIPLFEATALPELPELEGINTGQDELPVEEEEELEEPLGLGLPEFYDPLDGFEDAPPGGGDDQGGGDAVCAFAETEERHHTFLATAKTEISAADDNGNPGTGTVTLMVVEEMNAKQREECLEKCKQNHEQDRKEAEEKLRIIRFATKDDLPSKGWDHPELGGSRSAAIKTWQDKVANIRALIANCYLKCAREPNPEGPQETEYEVEAQNISCEAIDKGTTVVVSGTIEHEVYRLPDGERCDERFIPGTENLYVIVESCGCD